MGMDDDTKTRLYNEGGEVRGGTKIIQSRKGIMGNA